jgi:hypothetical protein
MAKIKVIVHSGLKELYGKIADLKAAKLLLDAEKNGLEAESLDKNFACFIKISSEDKTVISYNTLNDVCDVLGIKPEQVMSGEVKLPTDEAFYKSIKRTKIRPGRIFSKIIKKDILEHVLSNTDIEHFSNRYTAELNNQLTFELVSGEDIRKYYLKNNYSDRFGAGTLHGSCMNQDRQQEFLDIYTKNDNVQMLVAFDLNKKVAGRAIVWSKVSIKKRGTNAWVENQTYMDRIYYSVDWMVDKFKAVALKNGWYHRKKQAFDEEMFMMSPSNLVEEVTMKVPAKLNHKFFPYMDTFYVPMYKAGFMTNDRGLAESAGDHIFLRQTGGVTSRMFNHITGSYVDRNLMHWMKNKQSYHLSTEIVHSAKSDDYFLKTECIFSKLDNEHITPDEDIAACVVTGEKYKKARMVESPYHNGLIHKKESVETVDKGLLHKSQSVYSKTFKSNLSLKGAIKLDSIDDYVPSDVISKVPEKDFITFLEVMNQYLPKESEKKKIDIDTEGYVFEF